MNSKSLTVLHVGNSRFMPGGIASVIRQHLSRGLEGIFPLSVGSYRGRAIDPLAYLTAAWAILKLESGAVVHVHISQKGSTVREGSLALLAKITNHRVVVTLHGSRSLAQGRLLSWLLLFTLRSANVVHVFAESYAAQLNLGVKGVFLPNDVAVPEKRVPERTQEFVFAGVLGHRKGTDLLLDAWAKASTGNFDLILAGPVDKHSTIDLRSLPPGCRYLGELNHEQLGDVMRRAGVFILPSRAEAFPVAVCEAMAHGCAVIGTDVGGLGGLLRSSGQIVSALDVDALVAQVEILIADSRLRDELGGKAHRFARTTLASDKVNRLWDDLYRGVAQ